MEDYVGKTCPFCKTEIKEGEDIKVCDACGIPHHQECWDENKGCTTFGCSGCNSEQNHTCGNCGCELREGLNFCTNCGEKIYWSDNTDNQQFFNEQFKEKKHQHKIAKAIKKTIFFRKKKNCIITSSCFALVVFITLSLCFAGSVFFTIAYNSGNFDYAQQIKEMYSDNDFVSENIDGFLSACINKSYDKYNAGEVTIEDARNEYTNVAKFKYIGLEEDYLYNLEKSKNSFSDGENYVNNGDYLNAIIAFEKVIPKDKNYKSAKEKIETNKANLLTQTLEKLTAYENSNDFHSGLALINDVNKYFRGNADIIAKKESFRKQIINQLSQYESNNDYKDGLTLIGEVSSDFPDDSEMDAMKTSFEAMKEAARIEELKYNQQLTVTRANTYDDGRYIIIREAIVRVKNNTDKVVKKYYMGILLFNSNGDPVAVEYSYQGKGNLYVGIADDAYIQPGGTYGGGEYWIIADRATKIKACVIKVEYTDGTSWENEYADYWYDQNKDKY